MITFLIGTVENTTAESAILNVNGVGYEVICGMRTLSRCNNGDNIKLLTHLHIRENEHTLFGFWDEAERTMFRTLVQVSGVGPKVGIAILSALEPAQIVDAILTQSGKMMAQANGVGPKLGERIVRELKDKVGSLSIASGATVTLAEGSGVTSITADVMSALVNMGFKENQASSAVAMAVKKNPEAKFNALLKIALQQLR